MTEIKQVSLWRGEGKADECYPIIFVNSNIKGNSSVSYSRWKKAAAKQIVKTNDILIDVKTHLFEWGKTAPKRGYDKTDFHVSFDNGFTYEGRFDMEFGGLDDGQDFFRSLRGRMEYYSGSHWTDLGNWGPTKEEHEKYQESLKATLAEW
jgi:hypothetical protein